MLEISTEQLGALEAIARRRFVFDMKDYIERQVPAVYRKLGPIDVERVILNEIDRASAFGASTEISTARLIELIVVAEYAPDVILQEALYDALESVPRDPDDRIESMYRNAYARRVVEGALLGKSTDTTN